MYRVQMKWQRPSLTLSPSLGTGKDTRHRSQGLGQTQHPAQSVPPDRTNFPANKGKGDKRKDVKLSIFQVSPSGLSNSPDQSRGNKAIVAKHISQMKGYTYTKDMWL